MHLFNNIRSRLLPSEFEKQLAQLLGYHTRNINLFKTALNHRSVKEAVTENNERLEFLGDAVLGAVVAEYLFKKSFEF